jgi:hypothetical protein
MSDDTVFTRKAKGLLKDHGKTAIGGLGGASLVTIVAVITPYVHDIKDGQTKLWEQNASLRDRVTKLETKEEMIEKMYEHNSK